MYLKVNKKKYKIVELTKFWDRFKSLKFNLDTLDYVVKFPHKKFVSTDFICQSLDIILTDKEENILYMYPDFGTEKYIFPKRKVYNVYFCPLGTCHNYEVGSKLKIAKK